VEILAHSADVVEAPVSEAPVGTVSGEESD
jgi:hypothetical protein